MKKLLFLAPLLLPLVAAASSITCQGVLTTVPSLAGSTCTSGDLVYSFTSVSGYSGTLDVTISTSASGYSVVSFTDSSGGDLVSGFTVSYTITLDTTLSPASSDPSNCYIVGTTSGIMDDANGTGSFAESVTGSSYNGVTTATDTAGLTDTGTTTGLLETSLTITDTFILSSSGGILSTSNTFTQSDTSDSLPEPSTMVLVGGALIGLGVLTRKSWGGVRL